MPGLFAPKKDLLSGVWFFFRSHRRLVEAAEIGIHHYTTVPVATEANSTSTRQNTTLARLIIARTAITSRSIHGQRLDGPGGYVYD